MVSSNNIINNEPFVILKSYINNDIIGGMESNNNKNTRSESISSISSDEEFMSIYNNVNGLRIKIPKATIQNVNPAIQAKPSAVSGYMTPTDQRTVPVNSLPGKGDTSTVAPVVKPPSIIVPVVKPPSIIVPVVNSPSDEILSFATPTDQRTVPANTLPDRIDSNTTNNFLQFNNPVTIGDEDNSDQEDMSISDNEDDDIDSDIEAELRNETPILPLYDLERFTEYMNQIAEIIEEKLNNLSNNKEDVIAELVNILEILNDALKTIEDMVFENENPENLRLQKIEKLKKIISQLTNIISSISENNEVTKRQKFDNTQSGGSYFYKVIYKK